MKVEMVPVASLIPYARNARTHDDAQVAQIAASIREFGFCNPILIDEIDGIIAGHGRVLAARKLAMVDVPCIRLSHLTDTQRRAYILADNKLAMNSVWDAELLKLEMDDLKAHQLPTQSNQGGMTETYIDGGTYIKSFYSVMYSPSCVQVGILGDARSPHYRLHHKINWHHCAPKILREEHRKGV